MFAWDSWKLNSNIAMFTSTQKALWAHQRKNTAIEASTTDYHDGSVERHIDLKISLKFLTFLRAASSFLLTSLSLIAALLRRAHSRCSCFLLYCNWVSEPDWACSLREGNHRAQSWMHHKRYLLCFFFNRQKLSKKRHSRILNLRFLAKDTITNYVLFALLLWKIQKNHLKS